MVDRLQWQRQTALNKYARDKASAQSEGRPVHDDALIAQAAKYVGVKPDIVRQWLKRGAA